MKADEIDQIAVIGAGTMGHGIAELAALQKIDVMLQDINDDFLRRGVEAIEKSLSRLEKKEKISTAEVVETLKLITPVTDIDEAARGCDFAIEAVPEKEEIKRSVFSDLDEYAPPRALLATNTSSLSITDIANFTTRSRQVLGLHFFNPPMKMKLVEVIEGSQTSKSTIQTGFDFAQRLNKEPIHCRKDEPGFIVNAVLFPYLLEAGWLVDREKSTVRAIDSALKHKTGMPMGPFELMDLVGLDVTVEIARVINWPVSPTVEEKLDEGRLGRKEQEGFYNYRQEGPDYTESQGKDFDPLDLVAILVNEAGKLVQKKVATVEDVEKGLKLGAGFPQGPVALGREAGYENIIGRLDALDEMYNSDRYSPSVPLKEGFREQEL